MDHRDTVHFWFRHFPKISLSFFHFDFVPEEVDLGAIINIIDMIPHMHTARRGRNVEMLRLINITGAYVNCSRRVKKPLPKIAIEDR
jgi:hypothetical protein